MTFIALERIAIRFSLRSNIRPFLDTLHPLKNQSYKKEDLMKSIFYSCLYNSDWIHSYYIQILKHYINRSKTARSQVAMCGIVVENRALALTRRSFSAAKTRRSKKGLKMDPQNGSKIVPKWTQN